MMIFRWIFLAVVLSGIPGGDALWAASTSNPTAASPGVDRIMSGVEKKYAGDGFEARFHQTSTLKAMDITDTAEGRLLIKRPDKMRWEYETPERQLVITNDDTLWIYRPDDLQVMLGSAPEFFRGGKGAGFLSDIRRIRKHFDVFLEDVKEGDRYTLKLVPKDGKLDVVSILMTISATSFEVTDVTTTNSYGDQTYIRFDRYRFNLTPADDDFVFDIPEGADVIRLEE
ncbi:MULTISPECIES: LolA family protein [Desulfococcus]|jgi:outer membrane lipoprotein carrier protein|uniref:Outer membrane lipoprotein carrier protein LolA n=1 Tax=Desulfococcus multivorans DSM 2059 TaxID=1121405 RepID=S7VFU5_DESML|nr:outer membrane lipoprotein carrier protein LolA [Desulfococcus multivorans]AOY58561.1 LolA: predicted outer membrane lipoprotein carrier protein [Desulfococcus multivorans]AQV00867.1 lipoprotein carrier protein LolA [Desulfococcus multivorans]EPR43343.1 outer membrane lipoprotein carrier protein LolA [Desulfococcus multivorans DSM 2059]MDX9820028.1 outer membrane lipoprotein carrier protein LolA [Desulfococcus multivorans]SJZ43323.1 outer membrane lipoprotein carrier protein [Desulfococcus 